MTTLGVATPGWWDLPGLARFEAATGIRADVALTAFDDVSVPWNTGRAAPFLAHGTVPQITWGANLADVAAGKWDSQIAQTARWAGPKVQVRFCHEMNGTFSPYYGDPVLYVAAWKRARKVWRAAGSLAPWVWSPNVTGGKPEQSFAPYYPGDDQCELVGLDGYSYPLARSLSFAATFDADLTALGKLSALPLAICEVGVDQAVPNRAAWITDMWSYVLANPRISHVTYWNRDAYAIDGDPAAALAFHLGASAFRSH